MKKTFIFLIFNLVFYSCSPILNHIKTEEQVAEILTGYWKAKTPKSNIVYSFSFENLKGYYEELEPSEIDGEYMVVCDHPIVEIIKKGNKFNLKFTDLLESWNSKIKYLDKEKMILVTDGIETEYFKTE